MASPAVDRETVAINKADLHGSVSDPILDTMTFLNEITTRYPGAVSFAPGRPHDGLFDTEQIFTHLRGYLDHLSTQGRSDQEVRTTLYQYGHTSGEIRDIVARSLLIDENIEAAPESIVVTVGAQEAMLLVLRTLFGGPDDVLLVSSPCYVGITGVGRLLDLTMAPVEEREDGVSCADLEAAIRRELDRGRRPRAFYVVPDHSNPSGTTMPLAARLELLALADRYGILILEDSPYRLLSPGTHVPTLKSLDRSHRVIHIGSFSKTAFPGARLGFIVADQPVAGAGMLADELAKIKSMVTVNTSSLSQAVVAGMLLASGGGLAGASAEAATYYRAAMERTLSRLDESLNGVPGVRWNHPTGGFFLTLQVPFRSDNAALIRSAEDYGVLWTPMSYFYPWGGGDHAIRLSVSYLTPPQIDEGIDRLASFIRAEGAVAGAPR